MKPFRCPFCYDRNTNPYSPSGYSICNKCKKTFTMKHETRDIFLYLWRRDQNFPGYDKEFWNILQERFRLY